MLTRRSVLTLLAAAPAALRALPSQKDGLRVFVGTYTTPSATYEGSKGIYTATFDPANGTLSELELAAATPNPSYILYEPRTQQIFAANESSDYDDTLSAFSILHDEETLKARNIVNSGGSSPCHLALDRTGHVLFAANYAGGSITSYRVERHGLRGPISLHRFTGHGVDPVRQTSPHIHCSVVSPDNRFVLVNDLGLDRIHIFQLDVKSATLTPAGTPFWNAAPGSGPRHACFHPNGHWFYSINEMNSTIDYLHWHAEKGTLTHQSTVSTLPPTAQNGDNTGAEIAIDAEGRFLYVSNRGHNSIGVFALDSATGTPAPVQDIASGGKQPRFFTLDPTGRWLLVTHQEGGGIRVFARNPATGMLTDTGNSYELSASVCLIFL